MKILKWLDEYLEEALLGFSLIAMAGIMVIQVIARYLFGNSLTWSEEITRYIFIWSGFLSVSFCNKAGISIKINQLSSMLKGKAQWIVIGVCDLITIAFFAYLLGFAVKYLKFSAAIGQTSAACEIPMVYIHAAPVVGFSLVIIRMIEKWMKRYYQYVKKEANI